MENPKTIGDRSTLAVMLALQAADLPILFPFGENTRYDLVAELDGRLVRVQCKDRKAASWSRLVQGVCSTYAHLPSPRARSRDYHGQIDYFAVYCPETAGVYLIPIAALQTRWTGALRIDPPRNGQQQGVRFARDYLLGEVSVATA